MSRVGVFIDVQNCLRNINKRWPNRKLNYKTYLDRVKTLGTEIVRTIAYGTQIEDGAAKFIDCLSMLGYEPKYKTVEKFQWYSWNVGLSVDIFRNHEKLDIVVLGATSRDLVPLVHFLKDKGIRVIILACGIPRELRECCFKWIEIDTSMLEDEKD